MLPFAQLNIAVIMKQFGTAVILAGGKSTRMGFDKQLLTVNDKSLFDIVCESLCKVFDDIVVVTNKPYLYDDAPVRVFTDDFPGMGPLAGIHVALKNTKSKYVYLLACDMPIIRRDYIRYMMSVLGKTGKQICVTRRNGWIEPFNGFYSVDLLNDCEQRLLDDNSSVFRFIEAADTEIISEEKAKAFDTGLNMFTNLNTGDAYLKYLNNV